MPECVRCSGCSECAKVTPCGFTSVPYLFCTRFEFEVGADDGCTFGCPGDNVTGIVASYAILALHPSDDYSECQE